MLKAKNLSNRNGMTDNALWLFDLKQALIELLYVYTYEFYDEDGGYWTWTLPALDCEDDFNRRSSFI